MLQTFLFIISIYRFCCLIVRSKPCSKSELRDLSVIPDAISIFLSGFHCCTYNNRCVKDIFILYAPIIICSFLSNTYIVCSFMPLRKLVPSIPLWSSDTAICPDCLFFPTIIFIILTARQSPPCMAGLFSFSRLLRRATVSLRFSECLRISHREPTGAGCRIR